MCFYKLNIKGADSTTQNISYLRSEANAIAPSPYTRHLLRYIFWSQLWRALPTYLKRLSIIDERKESRISQINIVVVIIMYKVDDLILT